jgi:hypothetical protein
MQSMRLPSEFARDPKTDRISRGPKLEIYDSVGVGTFFLDLAAGFWTLL